MLGFIAEKTTALVSSTFDVVVSTGEYIWDDITSIPDAIEKGWSEGILPQETVETSEDVVSGEVITEPEISVRKFGATSPTAA